MANVIEGRYVQEFSFHTNVISGLDWISSQVFATCSMDGNIHFYEIGKESPIKTLHCGVRTSPKLLTNLSFSVLNNDQFFYYFLSQGCLNSICWDSGMNLLSSCDSEGIIKVLLLHSIFKACPFGL